MENKIIKMLSVAGIILTGSYGFCEECDRGDEMGACGYFSYGNKTAYSEPLYYVHKLIDEMTDKLEQDPERDPNNLVEEVKQLGVIFNAALDCYRTEAGSLNYASSYSNSSLDGHAAAALKLIQKKQWQVAAGTNQEAIQFVKAEMMAICEEVQSCLKALRGDDE